MRFREERDIWSELRSTRHSPPGAAGTEARRRLTYVTALQQAEELFRAARLSGAASSPLLQFYGLSQAGRALAAAAPSLSGDDWVLSGHGIYAPVLTADLPEIEVQAGSPGTPKGMSSSFVRLSLVLGSPLWPKTQPLRLTQAWDLLPELVDKPLCATAERRTPLWAWPVSGMEGHQLVSVSLSGLPGRLARTSSVGDEFSAFMESYPTAAGYRAVTRFGGEPKLEVDPQTDKASIQMSWRAGTERDVPEEVRSARLNEVLMAYREGMYLLLPETVAGEKPMHPLMSWWVVLFTLSMLARYEPSAWALYIDIDESKYANSIEYLLEEARVAVPDLVLTTLRFLTT